RSAQPVVPGDHRLPGHCAGADSTVWRLCVQLHPPALAPVGLVCTHRLPGVALEFSGVDRPGFVRGLQKQECRVG
ncbi:hypothetical protein SARC_14417, partial [Sphaeroforma arctica JP610]